MELTDRLQLKQGEPPTARHLRQLDALIAGQRPLGGPGILLKRYPWGTATCYRGQGGSGGTSDTFAPSIRRAQGGLLVRWRKGLIEGVEPTIDGAKISSGVACSVPAEAFSSAGESNLYFRTTYNANWSPIVCEPVASAEELSDLHYQSHKLALVLYADGTCWRGLYSNQGHLAINRRGSAAQHLYWGKL